MGVSLVGSRQLVVELRCKDGHQKVNVDLSPLLVFGRSLAERMAHALAQYSCGRALPAAGTGYTLARWGECIADIGVALTEIDFTDGAALDELHLQFLEWFFTRNPSVARATLQTLKKDWNKVGHFVRYCQKRGVLPPWDWFALPTEDATAAREGYVRARPREFIGEPKIELDHSELFTRIACTRSLAIKTSECLEQLSNELTTNLRRIEDACYRRIDEIRASFDEGERLAARADVELLKKLTIESPRKSFTALVPCRMMRSTGAYDTMFPHHVFSSRHPNGLANLLWWIKNRHDGRLDRLELEKSDPHMIKPMTRHDPATLRKYLGVLRFEELSLFVTVAVCGCHEAGNLSTILHVQADDLTQTESGGWRITAVKNRAHAEKSDLLDSKLANALILLRDLTATCRRVASHQPFLSNALFLGWRTHQQRGLPHRLINTSAAGKLLREMLSSNSELADLQMTTYSMIRNTHAIIEYIRSNGDWKSVASKLGNSISISMRHYVPAEVKNLLRERKVRQHQNEMLYVASVGQDYDPLLAVDLSSRADLESFLANSLQLDASKTNILLRLLAAKLIAVPGTQEAQSSSSLRKALIAISERNLALLFRYEECLNSATASTGTFDRPSAITGIAPNGWRNLARQLRALLASESYDNLEHRAIFKRSLALLPSLRTSIAFSA